MSFCFFDYAKIKSNWSCSVRYIFNEIIHFYSVSISSVLSQEAFYIIYAIQKSEPIAYATSDSKSRRFRVYD